MSRDTHREYALPLPVGALRRSKFEKIRYQTGYLKGTLNFLKVASATVLPEFDRFRYFFPRAWPLLIVIIDKVVEEEMN